MYDHRISGYEQTVTIIHPGEYLATSDDLIILTVLGSCIAVSLWDVDAQTGGLNHFMLPGSVSGNDAHDKKPAFSSDNAKYGMYAMELLINELMKLGCRKERLVAKVFGGGSVLGIGAGRKNTIPNNNITFAFDYLRTEGIPVATSDVGGDEARKILFFARSGKVLLKRISGTLVAAVRMEERSYLERIAERERKAGNVTLF